MAYKNVLLIDDDEEDQEIFLGVVTKLSHLLTVPVLMLLLLPRTPKRLKT
jgi:hypothetical protein